MSAPIILISSFATEEANAVYKLNDTYVNAIYKAGGIPFILPCTADLEVCKKAVEIADAVIIPGGADVSPYMYGEAPVRQVTYARRTNDLFDIELIKLAIAANKPLLGVCRGLQIINVALGGSLYQDIPSQIPNSQCHLQDSCMRDEPFHFVNVEPGSRFAKIFGMDKIETNTYHHQCIKDLAKGLKAVGHTADGVIELIEGTDANILGVQFHPECMRERYAHMHNVFVEFIADAKK